MPTTNSKQRRKVIMKPILVTGVGGSVGGLGQKIVGDLLDAGAPVRALVYRNKDVARELERKGTEVVMGNLTDLHDVHRAIDGCERMYFGMSVSEKYLEATVNVAAVAKHHGLQALVNMSQMTVSQMSITETTPSPQQKLHWLAEQALNWSGLPVVHVRPTMMLEGSLLILTPDSVRESNQIRLPFGEGKTSPVGVADVARAIAALLANPHPH